jgi:hypothetical protein
MSILATALHLCTVFWCTQRALAHTEFNPACNRSAYNVIPSNTSLPIHAGTDEVIAAIIPSPANSAAGGDEQTKLMKRATFLAMYNKGLQECEAFASTSSTSSEDGNVQPPQQHVFSEAGVFGGCRGRQLLRSLTGMVVWPFGPLHACTTHSTCWSVLLMACVVCVCVCVLSLNMFCSVLFWCVQVWSLDVR